MASEYLRRTPWTELRLAAVESLVDPRPSDRVLDLGCAAGAITHFLSTFGCDVVGVDQAHAAIARARDLFPELDFVEADVGELPLAVASFDKAVAADLVEHIDDATLARMLVEVKRVLVPRGSLSVYTPNPRHVIERLKKHNLVLAENPTHIGLRDASTLRRFLERAGFEVDIDDWRPSFFRGLRTVERVAGRFTSAFRYRLCVRAVSPG